MSEEPKRHTAVGEMAEECAKHHGTMILDVDVHTDGTSHIHAVATWDDEDEDAVRRMEGEGGLSGC